ncbi:transcription antitermination factor NusG [Christiangramia gaetbulicola]|uniref:Transcription antitermination factor NusG n=1 Tax=Christiangramia gaetbulicola TaxID=703340 RepID=A0A2T6ANC3_9FLAO|nr:UpxY family transcription antiterminator [Christiangramia gaetbulicola]PTX45318.1 transcription antitermination factor NusG [Christiangramia gaetbulicola]
MGWYVLYTKPRSEIKVADSLAEANFEVYCPTIKEVRQWSDRKKKVEVPLFSSYLFIKIKNSERAKVFNYPGVIKYLFWLGKPAIARDEEIEVIKNWLEKDTYDHFTIESISPGDRVKIKSGPFQNKEGIVQDIGSKRMRLILKEMGLTVNVKLKEIA